MKNGFTCWSMVIAMFLLVPACASNDAGAGGGGGKDAIGGSDAGKTDTAGPGGADSLPPFEPPEKNVLIGQVITPEGLPIVGATVSIGDGADLKTATTNYDGLYYLPDVASADRIVVRFEAPGFAAITRTAMMFQDGKATVNAVLLARAPAVPVTPGTPVAVSRGMVTVPAGAAVDAAGNAVDGALIRITSIDVKSPEISGAPGDFSAVDTSGGVGQLETFSMAEYQLTAPDGSPLQIKEGEKVNVEMLLPPDTTLTEGETVPAFYFDATEGRWVEEGQGTVQKYSQDQERLAYVADVGHFSWWNCDKTYESTCVRGKVTHCDGTPAGGADLLARGQDYDGDSMGYADSSGEFCVPVRKGSTVRLYAASGYGADRLVAVKDVTTPAEASKCPDGCANGDIQLPCTPQESDLDCDDVFFAGCKGCISGKVTTDDGSPLAYATVKVTTGSTSFTRLADVNGEYCSPAAEGSPATIIANGPGATTGGTSFTPTRSSSCPDCDQAPEIVLQKNASSSDLDLGPCLQGVGGIKLEPPVLNGADPDLARLDGGWAVLNQVSNGDQTRYELGIYLVPKGTTTDLVGNPSASLTLELPAAPGGKKTYAIVATSSDSYQIRGTVRSTVGDVTGLGNETYELDTASDPALGSGSITFDSGFAKAGDAVKGSFEVTFSPNCAPQAAGVTLRGTFDVALFDNSQIPYAQGTDSPEFKSWECGLYGSVLSFLGVDVATYWNGSVAFELDGQPVPTDPESLSGFATYSSAQDVLQVQGYGLTTTASLTVTSPRSGGNAVTSATLYLDGSSCYYGTSAGAVTIMGFSGADSDTFFTGTFDIDFEPGAGSTPDTCPSHKITGQFGAPVCR